MNSEPAVISVLVANYNGAEVIRACLDSIIDQQVDVPVEVLVFDDASQDDSPAIVADEYPSVHLHVSKENVGFCRANNLLAELCRGDFLLLLNNDAWLEQGSLAALLSAARGGADVLTLPQLDAVSHTLLDAGMGLDLLMTPYPLRPASIERRNVPTAMGACLWLPKTLWEDIGGFPEWFESIGEDLYLCQVARVRGASVEVLREPSYLHRVGHSFGGGKVLDSGLQTTLRRRRLSERNVLYVLFVVYPLWALILLLPIKLLILLIEGLVLSLVKTDFGLFRTIYWNAMASLWRQRTRLLDYRRRVQDARTVGALDFMRSFSFLPYKFLMVFRHGFPDVR